MKKTFYLLFFVSSFIFAQKENYSLTNINGETQIFTGKKAKRIKDAIIFVDSAQVNFKKIQMAKIGLQKMYNLISRPGCGNKYPQSYIQEVSGKLYEAKEAEQEFITVFDKNIKTLTRYGIRYSKLIYMTDSLYRKELQKFVLEHNRKLK